GGAGSPRGLFRLWGREPLALNRRTRHRAVGAEHAAIAGKRHQTPAAVFAMILDAAGVVRHALERAVPANGTGHSRFANNHHASTTPPVRAAIRLRHRCTAISAQIASTRPNGHAPCMTP